MIKIEEAVRNQLLAAKGEDEVKAILADNGLTVTDEDFAQIMAEIEAMPADGELSIDELEAISGGWRDWLTEGCYSTVEADSWCAYSSDMCLAVYHHYDHEPYRFQWCHNCGSQMGHYSLEKKPGSSSYSYKVKCPKCGAVRWAHEY